MRLKASGLWVMLTASVLLSGCVMTLPNKSDPPLPVVPPSTVTRTYSLPAEGDDVVGAVTYIHAQKGDTLATLAQQDDFGYQELVAANPDIVDPNHIPVGTKITLPSMYVLPPAQYRKGIVINIPELRMYYFGNGEVTTFPVALGRDGWRTPIAKTYVYSKQAAPTWHVPESIRQTYFEKYGQEQPKEVGPGPDNPLGNYAIYLQMTGYLIHGTNVPSSVGNFVSSGCVRMYPQDIEKLFNQVQRGTPVNIIYYPSLAGWLGKTLYLESHAQISHEDGLYQIHEIPPEQAVQDAIGARPVVVNWAEVNDVVRLNTGLPTAVGQQD